MSLAAAGRIRREMCSSIICIDEYSNYKLSGRIYHSSIPEGRGFDTFIEFIDVMEEVFDSMDYPQSSVEFRSFAEGGYVNKQVTKTGMRCSIARNRERGELATFSLRVMFRQNASWQGVLRWLEEEKEADFRSILELLKLLESALPAQQAEVKADTAI